MAAKVFEKSAEETAFRAVLKEVYESGKNSVAVLWADAALSARFQETLYAFLLKDVLGSAAAGVKLRALCAFCGGEAETAQTEYTHETFIGLMSPITKGENKGAVRLDLFFKKGEAHFIPTLFAYVMNNILGDCFKKAVPDSLDRELEGEDGSNTVLQASSAFHIQDNCPAQPEYIQFPVYSSVYHYSVFQAVAFFCFRLCSLYSVLPQTMQVV